MIWFRLSILPALGVAAFLVRDNPYALSIISAAFGVALTEIYTRASTIDRNLMWSSFKAATVHANASVRVSIAYLICIHVDDSYLLVRGSRIRTQYQPVGGVYKSHLTKDELFRKFQATEDVRFKEDTNNIGDLRIVLPGKRVPALLRWFKENRQREVLPTREFFEELVSPGFLSSSTFPYIDCVPLGRRCIPIAYERSVGMQQIILADIWKLQCTEPQLAELRLIREQKSRLRGIMFATRKEIETGAKAGKTTTADIAKTALWLLQDSRR